MIDISVGAVGAAIIAGLVSLLGLIIGKEQKVSEFRQAWIDELRKCLIGYLANVNSIADTLRLRAAGGQADNAALVASYKSLNEASHGIILRVNSKEKPAKALLKVMGEFQSLAADNANLTPDKIKVAEEKFVRESKKLLKFEWIRVKRGENVFVWTKRIVWILIIVMIGIFGYLLATRTRPESEILRGHPGFQLIRSNGAAHELHADIV